MRRRARLLVISIALLTSATIASGDFTVVTSPTTHGGTAAADTNATTMRTVFSVRNNDPDPVTATITPGVAAFVSCTGLTLTDIDGATAPQWPFAANEQRQFVITTSLATPGVRTCQWTVMAPGEAAAMFTSEFNVVTGTGDILNVQPAVIDFAVFGTSMTQTTYVQNYTMAPLMYANATINDGGTGVVRFEGGTCNGQQMCPGVLLAAGSYQVLDIKCTPPPTGQVSGTITYMVGASLARTQSFTCRRAGQPAVIDIAQSGYILEGTPGSTATATADIVASMGATTLQSAAIVGADPTAFRLPACGGTQSCTFPTPIAVPTTLAVECTPGMSQKTAILRVRGTAHANDLDEATLTCVADGGLSATPSTLDFGNVKVTTTSAPQTVTIENLGSTQASVLVDTGHPDWLVDMCAASPCTIAPGGMQPIQVRFEPSTPAENDRTLTISLNGSPAASVALEGNGVGSRMRVTNHAAPYLIDFGTIGLGTTRERTVALQADGNRSLNIAIGMPAAPFSTSAASVDLPAGAEGMFDIACQSNSPGLFNGMVTLAPGPDDHVYAADTPKLDVRCRVANTPVQLTPDELDFGEVRRGTPPPTIDVEIHNPSTSPISLDYVRLANASALSISMPNDDTLDPNETITIALALATTTEITVQSALEVGVGGEQLVTPITGKVVTASARVTPTTLRLGSVCIGTMIDEPVKLVNDGTARLRVQPPTMQHPFAVTFVDPVSYPTTGALLGPLEEAIAAVRISTADKGRVTGKLTWDVDVPDAPFVIEATLDVKDAGIAVSPQAIGFDEVRVDERSDRRTIRLENCGDFVSEVVLAGVSAVRGSANAWELTPETLTTQLEPRAKLSIEVRFAPTRSGPHVAIVKLAVDGVAQEIELTGDALGDADRGSLYACSCNAPGAPWQAPLLLVVLFVICRRRTGSSSAR